MIKQFGNVMPAPDTTRIFDIELWYDLEVWICRTALDMEFITTRRYFGVSHASLNRLAKLSISYCTRAHYSEPQGIWVTIDCRNRIEP